MAGSITQGNYEEHLICAIFPDSGIARIERQDSRHHPFGEIELPGEAQDGVLAAGAPGNSLVDHSS